jgi:DNA-binding NarL/FixJ family response regulator
VMVMADVPSGDIRLVLPEDLVSVRGEVATVRADGERAEVAPVLHLRAGGQVGSELGVSFLEPFVVTCANRDTFLSSLLTSELILASRTTNDELLSWANEIKPYAMQQLRALEERTRAVLGRVTEGFVDAAPGTYFEGQERMTPSAGRIALVENLDHVLPYGHG